MSENGNHSSRLTLYIVLSIVAAVVLAIAAPTWAIHLTVGGEIFLRLLQMIVVPLVMASVMSGILGLGDVRKLGRPGGYAVLYYLSTTILAVITGLIVVNTIRPGIGIDRTLVEDARKEGAKEVRRAQSGMQRQSFTWNSAVQDLATEDGLSDTLELGDSHSPIAKVTIVQVRRAEKPASIRLLYRTSKDKGDEAAKGAKNKKQAGDEEDEPAWRLLAGTKEAAEGEPTFTAGVEPATYTFERALPADADEVRIDFVAQTGEEGASFLRAELAPGPPNIGDIFENLVLMLFTNNLLASMVEINLLPIIVFSIVFAAMLTTMGQRSETIGKLVVSINDALMSFILLLMKLAPIGIFCLVAARFAKAQLDGQFIALLKVQAYYMSTVLAGLAIHALLTLPLILWIFTRRNPYRFLGQMSQAVLTAFSTASSTATLPITMECAEKNAGVSKRSTEFVLPLGATINMDGTALYEAAGAIFIAQAFNGANPDFLTQVTIAVTATLAAIGAAGIPEAGLVTMLIVLNAVGLPIEMIGLVLPVDWLLDRFRTAVNAFGDSVGSAIVDQSFEPETATTTAEPNVA